MKTQVTCNRKDQCQVGCGSKLPHIHNQGCEVGCVRHGGIHGAICLPEPALVRCDTAGEAGACEDCDHGHDHAIIPFRCRTKPGPWFSCPSTNTVVHCNPVPEPAAPHGASFKGTASQLVRYFAGMTEERFQALMHADFTIMEAEDRKAVAERIMRENGQGDREAEAGLDARVLAEIHSFGARTRGMTNANRIYSEELYARSHIMKLIE